MSCAATANYFAAMDDPGSKLRKATMSMTLTHAHSQIFNPDAKHLSRVHRPVQFRQPSYRWIAGVPI